MSDACILCDANVPRGAQHYVVDLVESREASFISRKILSEEGPMCYDRAACWVRAFDHVIRGPARNEFQAAARDDLLKLSGAVIEVIRSGACE